jgi:hypothetical protein
LFRRIITSANIPSIRPAIIDSPGKPDTGGYTMTDVIVEVLTEGVLPVEVLALVDISTEVDVIGSVDVETD